MTLYLMFKIITNFIDIVKKKYIIILILLKIYSRYTRIVNIHKDVYTKIYGGK